MALYNLISRDQAFGQANNNYSGDDPSLRLYNLLNGKKADAQYSTDDNLFSKKARSLENAFGTTGAALVSAVDSARENDLNEKRQKEAKQSLDDIAKKYGYNSKDEYWDASNAAEKEIFGKYGFDSDAYWNKHEKLWTPTNKDSKEVKDLEATRQDVINRMSQEDADKIKKFDSIASELQGQTKKNADIADKAAKDWKNYREDSYVGQKVNQDRGKFLGSSINTLSTMSDVLLPGAGVAFNAAQGGIEGIADELEHSGFKNFDWERAGQNALIGATTGAVTGGLNKGISNVMAKNGGNLFKGSNALTRGLNNLGSKTAVGRVGSTLATGAARGAVSGVVGGATGAGLSAAMNGQDVLQSALQGAVQGAQQGATTGGIMAGANMALSKTPGVGNMMRQLNEAGEDWNNRKARGESFRERLANTKNSGDSVVGNFLNDPKQSLQNLADKLPAPGMIVKDVSGDGMLNLEKGDTLPLQARLKTLEEITDGQYKTIGDLIDDGMTMQEIKRVLPKRTYDELESEIRTIAEVNNPLEQISQYNDTSKSQLPQLNRQQYYEETMGKVGKDGLSYKDVPEYMQSHLSNNVARNNDEILRDYFKDNGLGDNTDGRYSTSELYEMYDRIANGPDANAIFTSENINDALDVMSRGNNEGISERIGNRIFGDERRLKIEGGAGRNNNINVRNDNASWESDMAGRQDDAMANMMASVPEEMRMPKDIRNMRINDGTQLPPETGGAGNAGGIPPRNHATELYDSLNRQPQEPIDLTSSFGDKGLGNIGQRNKLQALGQQLQNSAKTQKYAPIYDSLDARTAKRAAETNAPQQLADLGVKPQDYNEYAKTSSYVNRVVSDLAKKSGIKVNAPDLPTKLSADNIDVVMSDSALKKYNGYIKQIVPDGDSPTQYSASYLLEKSRELGNKAANLRGNTDDVSALRQALTDAKYTLRDIATNALEGSLVTGDATNDMIAQGLKNLGANEKVQDYYTEAVDGKAPSVSDYIRRSSLFEQARDMGTQVDAEKYTRSASKAPTRFATKVLRASGLEQPIETLLRNTVAPIASGITNTAGKAIEGVGNAMAGVKGNSGGDAATTTTSEITTNPNYNPQTRLYDAIGRTEGAITRDNARNGAYLADVAQEAEVVPNTMMQTASMPTSDSSTALYNSVTGTAPAQTATTANTQGAMPSYGSQSEEQATYFFPPTGDYWSDMLSQAMRRAKNAGDYDALGQLFEMYQTQANKLEKQAQSASTSTKSTKLTDTQRRANAAMNSLDRISTMTPDLGYNLSGIPVIGDIATWGGNDYESEAKSLAQQIGYMLSGANIKEEEAYNIGKAYVPQPFDSEQTRKSKLQRAYDIIQQYQNGYAE